MRLRATAIHKTRALTTSAWSELGRNCFAVLVLGGSAAVACTGSLDVKGSEDDRSTPVAGTASAGTSGATAGASSIAGSGGVSEQPTVRFPFEPVAPRIYVAKVKNLMLGSPATEEEIGAVASDPGALKELVHSWFVKPEAQDKLGAFFSKAFQQTQVSARDFADQLGVDSVGNLPVFVQAQESMARTALKLIAEGKSFTETVTTRTFMMTPALMSLYLALDQIQIDDGNKLSNSLPLANGTLSSTQSFWITFRPEGPIPLSETIDPASPNFMHFAVPSAFACDVPKLDATGHVVTDATGNAVRVKVYYNQRKYTSVGAGFLALFGHATTRSIVNDGMDPLGPPKLVVPADVPPEKRNLYIYNCSGGTSFAPGGVTPQDSIWRPVTVRQAKDGEKLVPFYDLPKLREANEIVVRTPRIGYFTTPAFFANWPSNASNQQRGTLNQALIVGLGRSINPVDKDVATVLDNGKDGQHSDPNSPCYSCHQIMDPMRNVFRQAYTHSYHAQHDPSQVFATASFDYLGATAPLASLEDFAQAIVKHPQYPRAWAQKLCYYANSGSCSDDDPEFSRVAQAFVDSGFDFHTLVTELFASPIVTGVTSTKTRTDFGEVISIARQDHFCAALTNRLKLASSLCANIPDKNTASAVANNVPVDGYLRGADAPALSTSQTPFYRGATESLCSYAASLTVDKMPMSRYSSAKKDSAIADFVENIMGVTAADSTHPAITRLLQEHYDAAVLAGATPTDALKSTFVTACLSPTSVAVGL